ncbi:MAG: hypothetical protein ACP5IE_03960 [Infirmifilum sp.]
MGVDYEGVSFILNSGADGEVEIVQRLGRASRSGAIPRITLGIILSKNVPLQSYRIHDNSYIHTIIYMLSGVKLPLQNVQQLGLRILKDARPIAEFGHLLLGTLKMYRNNPNSMSKRLQLCDYVSELKKNIDSDEVSKSLSDFLDRTNICNSADSTQLDIHSCRQIFEEDMKYGRLWIDLEQIPDKLVSLEKRAIRALDELSQRLGELIQSGKLQPNQVPESLKQDQLKYYKNVLASKFDEARTTSRAFTMREDKRNVIDALYDIINEIYKIIHGIYDSTSEKELAPINLIKEIREQIKRIRDELDEIRNTLINLINSKSLNYTYRVKDYEICDKIIQVQSSIGNNLSKPVSVRDFIFGYSSLSPSLLTVEDKGVKKVRVNFYELEGEKWLPARQEPMELDIMNALNRFPPFTVFNYESYVKSSNNTPDIPRYGIVLLPLYYRINKWGRSIESRIKEYLSVDITKVTQTNEKLIDINEIDEIKVYNILGLSYKLNSSIKMFSNNNFNNNNFDPLFLEFGIDFRKSGLNNKNFDELIKQLKEMATKQRGKAQKRASYNPLILNYAGTCEIGRALSTNTLSTKDCPFKDRCPFGREVVKSRYCPHWSKRIQQMKKTELVKKVELAGKIIDWSSFVTPLIKVSRIKSLKIFEEIDKIQIFIKDTPRFIHITPKLVHQLHDTNGIRIKLNRTLIKNVLYDILFGNKSNHQQELLEILLTKYYITLSSATTGNVYDAVGSLGASRYTDIYAQVTNSKNKRSDAVQDFLNFAYNVLVHTLAHEFMNFLVYKLDIDEDLIDYYIHGFNLANPSEPADSLYIFENTVYGALKLTNLIMNVYNNDLGKMVKDFLLYVYKSLKMHESTVQSDAIYLKSLKQKILNSGSQSDAAKYVRVAEDRLSELHKSHIRPDLYVFKLFLAENFEGSQSNKKSIYKELTDSGIDEPDESVLLSYADVVVGEFCVDGCSSCVMSDKCHYTLHQNLLVSRRLLSAFLDIVLDANTESLKNSIRLPAGTSDDGFALLEEYGSDENLKEVEIASAYIDESCTSVIGKILRGNPNVKVVLCVNKQNFEEENKKRRGHLEEEIKKLQKEYGERFTFRLEEGTHKKEYVFIFNNGEQLIIDGSWNCHESKNSQNFNISKATKRPL